MTESALIEKVMSKYGNHVKALSTVAIIITSIVGIAGGYFWYRSNIWRPSIEIIKADFPNAMCVLNINGDEKVLYGNATLAAGAAWGVRFGTTQVGEIDMYNTIELVKEDRVYEIYQIYEINEKNAATA